MHNLKNLDLRLPRRRLVVVTGPSGSGKSSLAFDTLYAEGQRRYIESLSSYAHQFLDQLPKPDVDRIDGLSPALAIDQKGLGSSPRSTVGTITEISSFLRLLYARCGTPFCPDCELPAGEPAAGRHRGRAHGAARRARASTCWRRWCAGARAQHRKLLEDLLRDGYVRALIDGELRDLDDDIDLAAGKRHDIAVVVDGLTRRDDLRERLRGALEQAAATGRGLGHRLARRRADRASAAPRAAPAAARGFPELDPRLFSFNSPVGSCPECNGLGTLRTIPEDLLVPDQSLQPRATAPWSSSRARSRAGSTRRSRRWPARWASTSRRRGATCRPTRAHTVLHGLAGDVEKRAAQPRALPGLPQGLAGAGARAGAPSPRDQVGAHPHQPREDHGRGGVRRLRRLPACARRRCRSASAASNIGEVVGADAHRVRGLGRRRGVPRRRARRAIATPILEQIRHRLQFLLQVGVSYLSLARATRTLSGGEGQRVRLATQVGSQLTGVLYILDEPSVGLHHRDIHRLIATLKALRDRGNTVVVVEHDRDVMLAADHILDLGPGRGRARRPDLRAGHRRRGDGHRRAAPTGDFLAGRVGGGGPAPLSAGPLAARRTGCG